MNIARPVSSAPVAGAVDRRQDGWPTSVLADVSFRFIKGQDVDAEVLPALFRTLADKGVIDGLVAFIVDQDDKGMRLGAMEGFDPDTVRKCLRLDFGQAICGTVAARRRGLHVTDIQRTLDPMADLVRASGVTAYASEPLVVGDRLLGTLSFASRRRREFETEHLLLLRDVARLIAVARNRMLAEAQERGG